MTAFDAAKVLARLSLLRMVRGKTMYITSLLVFVPLIIVLLIKDREDLEWRLAVEAALGLVIPLGAAVHVSGAVNDELEQKTYTFLWSRPIHRASILFGRLLAMTPLLFALGALSILLAAAASNDVPSGGIPVALGAVLGASVGCSLFALGAGAMYPRYATIITIAFLIFIEQIMAAIPVAQKASIVAHARALAGHGAGVVIPAKGHAIMGLLIVGGAWLALAYYKVTNAEYAAAKEQ
jgi:ABC-type transport system involved in multi-copper enzyme maturation permease subunit